jgi:hypothetical protein
VRFPGALPDWVHELSDRGAIDRTESTKMGIDEPGIFQVNIFEDSQATKA